MLILGINKTKECFNNHPQKAKIFAQKVPQNQNFRFFEKIPSATEIMLIIGYQWKLFMFISTNLWSFKVATKKLH